jgi:hypothetical protein
MNGSLNNSLFNCPEMELEETAQSWLESGANVGESSYSNARFGALLTEVISRKV